MNIRLPNVQLPPVSAEELERRSRLVALVYEVLRKVEAPADGATDIETCSILSRAFAEKAIELANHEAAEPRTGRDLKTPRPT